MTWTADRIEKLTTRWAEGASGAVIATEMGGLTRSAVIGMAHRLGLPRRKTQQASKPKPRPRRSNRDVVGLLSNRAADRGKVKLPESKVPVESTANHCTLFELTNESCRWPLGGPLEPAKFFCGAPSTRTYCGFHSRFAYREYHR